MSIRNIQKPFIPATRIVLLVALVFAASALAQTRVRTEIPFPDVPGYITLKCDFHMHTVFSDGSVWPTVRPEEAWREGLDAIAITDHIEYVPHKDDIPANFNRSYDIAQPRGASLGLQVIRGSEITRGEPPGHWNAIFLKDSNPLDTKEYLDALKAAIDQGAFIFWNHPGWKQPERKSVWYDEQNEVYEKGWLHGIEVVNGNDYDPIAHQWCLDKKLTMLGNSDIHDPINLRYCRHDGLFRPMTLVFAKEKTIDSVKEALFDRRTVVYCNNMLIGEEKFLAPLFERSIEILTPEFTISGRNNRLAQINNKSPIDFELQANGKAEEVTAPGKITLYAGKTVLMDIRGVSEERSGQQTVSIPYRVQNLKVTPSEGLPINLQFKINFIATKK